MRLSLTLSTYVGRQFLVYILLVLGALLAIALLADVMELARRTSDKSVAVHVVVEMALLRIPTMAERLLPFGVLIGGIVALTRLTRTYELAVMRAAGVSVWQFLLPGLALVLTIGVFSVMVLNTLSAVMTLRFEQLERRYITGMSSMLSVSSSGLWLRQVEKDQDDISEYIIHAQQLNQGNMHLRGVTLFVFDAEHRFAKRMDAHTAYVDSGELRLQEVTVSTPGESPIRMEDASIVTELDIAQIQDNFASPRTLSFWELPGFIAMLEQAGFSAQRHKLHWHALLASPLLLCAMLLIAATFSLRLPRRGYVGFLIVAGIGTGFSVRFLTDIIHALGLSGNLPLLLSAWSPATISLLLGGALLLHLEDG